MNLGAMIDLGVDPDYLRQELSGLPVHGYELRIKSDSRKGISGTRVEVIVQEDHSPDHHHEQAHNNYLKIREMILSSNLNSDVSDISLAIFKRIAEAEAKIHQVEINKVHFHEVGAVDSIVDIVGAAVCISYLKPDLIYASPVELGSGMVQCSHGIYPVPAPATAEIIRDIPVKLGNVEFEATTPTGAAILATIVDQFTARAEMNITRTGYGIGGRDGKLPNVLRVFIGEMNENQEKTKVSYVVECNIDDMNPEYYDYIMDSLFNAGARDVYLMPVIMKKSRPGVILSVLCEPDMEDKINEILLKETTTLGIRRTQVVKTMLDRKSDHVSTRYGTVRVKSGYYKGTWIKSKPEYEDCIRVARENKIPLSMVYKEVERIIDQQEQNG